MENNKFEQGLKAQLEKRRIQPSAGGWEKLNSHLEGQNQRVDNRKWWFGAAVAAVAALVVSVFVFNQDTASPGIVEEPVNELIQEPATNNDFISPVGIASEDKDEELKSSEEENRAAEIASASEDSTPVSERKAASKEIIVLERIAVTPPEEEIDEFSEEMESILATVNKREVAGNSVTDAEIDMLLAKAAADITRKESFKTPEIDAEGLLAEVEEEIYQSFKEKIFIVLKEGFVKARTAVANRNN